MITGFIDNQLDPVIPLQLTNDYGIRLQIEAVIDTGFTEFLTLPLAVVQQLQLAQVGRVRVLLSGNLPVDVPVYMVHVLWHGQERLVSVQQAEGDPLVGMQMLVESKVTLHVRYGGAVEVEPGP